MSNFQTIAPAIDVLATPGIVSSDRNTPVQKVHTSSTQNVDEKLSAATLHPVASVKPLSNQPPYPVSLTDNASISDAGTSSAGTASETLKTSETKMLSSQSSKQYILADGTVTTTGKGLGKGRPGVKRGPRSSKVSDVASQTSSPVPPSQSPIQVPITPNAIKRKRTDSIMSNVNGASVASSHSRESTPEYNPTSSQTRSGRQTQRPASIIITSATTESPAPKRTLSASNTSTSNLKTHPKIKRRIYKGKEQSALCEHCLRGFGPSNNVIVFCDACNKCWHQRCHSPPISKDVVADTKAEWFCSTCDKILHGNKKAKKSVTAVVKPELTFISAPPPPVQQYGLPIVGAVALSPEQQRTYLNTLSKDKLISLILKAGSLAPQLPMFETPLPPPAPFIRQPLPQFASNYVTPVDPAVSAAMKAGPNEVLDEGHDDRFDEHAALYPKPGEGVQLPPDRNDIHMLLEGPDSRTFSHWVRGMNMKNYLDNTTLVQG